MVKHRIFLAIGASLSASLALACSAILGITSGSPLTGDDGNDGGTDGMVEAAVDAAVDGAVDATVDAALRMPTPVATGQPGPVSIAVQDAGVYWVNIDEQRARTAQQNGGSQIVFLQQVRTPGLAVDDRFVYNSDGNYQLWHQALDGSGAQPLALSTGKPVLVAADDTRVFIVDATSATEEIHVITKGAADAVWQPSSAVAFSQPGSTTAIALFGERVYWTNQVGDSTGQVLFTPKDGTLAMPAGTIADAQGAPTALAVDAYGVFWTTRGTTSDGTLHVVPVAAGPAGIVAQGLSDPEGVALDDAYVYWANAGTKELGYADGSIQRAPKGLNAKVETLAIAQAHPVAIAVSGGAVYWANRGGMDAGASGAIMRLALGPN